MLPAEFQLLKDPLSAAPCAFASLSIIMHHYITSSKCSVSILFWDITPWKNYSNMHWNISHFVALFLSRLIIIFGFLSPAVTSSLVAGFILNGYLCGFIPSESSVTLSWYSPQISSSVFNYYVSLSWVLSFTSSGLCSFRYCLPSGLLAGF